jgi:hypothetical protein
MNLVRGALVIVSLVSFVSNASAETSHDRVRALRLARNMVRQSSSAEVEMLKNKSFDGIWGGRYYYASAASTCPNRIPSFNFRHLLVTHGGSGYLSTNHAGDFTGRSRDKGRRWEFVKSVTISGRPALIGVIYGSLAKNGNTAVTAAAIVLKDACTLAYGSRATRLAR